MAVFLVRKVSLVMPAAMSTVRRTTSWPTAAVAPWTQTWLGISGKGPSPGAPLLTAAPPQAVQHWRPWRLSPSEYRDTGQTLLLLCIPLHEDHVTWRRDKHEDHVTWRRDKLPIHLTNLKKDSSCVALCEEVLVDVITDIQTTGAYLLKSTSV